MELASAVSKKATVPAYMLLVMLGVLVGLAGVFLPPLFFAAAVAGLVVAAVALAKTEFAIALLVLVVPLANVRASLGPIPLDAVTICSGLVIASYALNNLGKKGETAAPTPYTWIFLLFLLFSAISAIVAPSKVESVAVMVRFVGYFLLVAIIGRSVKSRETLTWILVLMVVSGAITGLYGIYQYLYAPDTAKIGLYDLTDEVAARVGSTFENPNFYAEYLVLLVPIGLALILGSRGVLRRLIIGGSTLFIFAGLILTYTRGSWMATAIGIVLMSLLTEAWLFWVWAGLFAVALVAAPGVASRFASITNVTGGTAGFRMKLWKIAGGIIREHPLIGIGIGNYYDAFTEYIFRHPEMSVGWVIYGAHNSYLTIMAETGIFGILSFVAIILIAIKYGLYLAREKAEDKYLAWINSAIFAGVVGFAINSLTSNSFHHPQGAVFFWVFLGLQVAIGNMKPEIPESKTSPAIEGSLLLRPVRAVFAAYKAAVASHPVYKLMRGFSHTWRESVPASLLYRKPATPDLFSESRIYKPAMVLTEAWRRWYEGSALYVIGREVAVRPLASAIAFIAVALASRMLLAGVVG